MKKILVILSAVFGLFLFSSCDEDQINDILNPGDTISETRVVAGLKEALRVGTDTSVSVLNQVNGYFTDQAVKIFLPEDIQKALNTLKNSNSGALNTAYQTIQNSGIEAKMVESLNRAAENAADKAKPIFWSAITNITVNDGFNILYGEDTAATGYLRTNTYTGLFNAFEPEIDSALDKPLVLGESANKIFGDFKKTYNDAANIYNTATILTGNPQVDLINNMKLSEHTTHRGLRGLFIKVAEEEKDIRKDPLARVNTLLQDVFGLLD